MARIIAISSQVARGHVGLSAIVPALQALGHEVIALPTTVLSNHPGHTHVAGEQMAPEVLARMFDALGANGWLGGIDAVITGYMPSAGHVALTAAAIEQLKELNSSLIYLCDPVLGDEPKGVYIAHDSAKAIRDSLLPLADILKLNRFELEWISGVRITDAAIAQAIVRFSGRPRVAVTSLPVAGAEEIGNGLVVAGEIAASVSVPRLTGVPNGTGDLMGALLIGHHLSGAHPALTLEDAFRRAVDGVRLVVERSLGADQLQVVASLHDIAARKATS